MSRFLFHHVGVGTRDFDRAIGVYESLGHEILVRADDERLNVRIALLAVPGRRFPYIEVVSPLGPNGPLEALLKRKVLPAPYHTCYATPDIHVASAELRERGFAPLSEPTPAVAFEGKLISFHFSGTIGLIELLQDAGYPESPSLLGGRTPADGDLA